MTEHQLEQFFQELNMFLKDVELRYDPPIRISAIDWNSEGEGYGFNFEIQPRGIAFANEDQESDYEGYHGEE